MAEAAAGALSPLRWWQPSTAYVYFDARACVELEHFEAVAELPEEIQLTTTG